MNLSDFDYNLPPELIAIEPANPRDSAKLLVVQKENKNFEHKVFSDLIDYLNQGDVLILNNSKVIPARLIVERLNKNSEPTGGKGEVFLCSRQSSLSSDTKDVWQVLIKGRTKPGSLFRVGKLVIEAISDCGDGTWIAGFNLGGEEFMRELRRVGAVPLPPYIEKRRHDLGKAESENSDLREYQTVFAREQNNGSVAAPTAGLHFTPELLEKIEAKGIKICFVTLHVGLGTFLPVKVDKIENHKMHAEWAEVPAAVISTINEAKNSNKKVIAVGTTSARTIEACFKAIADKKIEPSNGFAGWVDIFIYPGYQWLALDGLVTNFHLPKSTLMMLVSAMAGCDKIMSAYQVAIEHGYRFYSYGDAMLII